MSARDDFGSNSGTSRGYSGGAGGLGNGGVGGGMGGGGMGGGAGRNGGIGSRTGLTTGNRMYGGMAMGRPGGMAQNPGAWGMRPQAQVSQAPLNRPTRAAGLLGNPVPASVPGVNPMPPEPVPQYGVYPGTGSWWSGANWSNDATTWPQQPSAAPYDPNAVIGGSYPTPSLSGKPISDQAPYDPNFGGNTFNQYTGHVGNVGGRGWGGGLSGTWN